MARIKENKIYIYGRHAVKEAIINAPRAILKVFLKNRDDIELEELIKKSGVAVAPTSSSVTDEDTSHQGVIASIQPEKLVVEYSNFIRNFNIKNDSSFVFLAGLQDPQNVGAIIRSAAAFGISAVLMPKREQVKITGAVAKVSAGMVFRVPIVLVDDVATSLEDLKKKGFTAYGMDGNSKIPISDEPFGGPTVFIMGNESKGLGDLNDLCDKTIAIPMDPKCESLNVAVSAGIAFYAWSLRHKDALK